MISISDWYYYCYEKVTGNSFFKKYANQYCMIP